MIFSEKISAFFKNLFRLKTELSTKINHIKKRQSKILFFLSKRSLLKHFKERQAARKSSIEKQRQKKAELEALLEKKPNWQEFQQVLHDNNITTLYHFTDRANIKSIKKHGGLYSWQYCDNNGIKISQTGGNPLSRGLDTKYDLQNYVRVSFIKAHPMMFVAEKRGRIQNPVILTISLDVCNFAQTRFADMNATKKEHRQGENLEDLNRIHFNTVKLPNHFGLDKSEKPYFQAELLVNTWIPIKYITNIKKF